MKKLVFILLIFCNAFCHAQDIMAIVNELTDEKKKADTLFTFSRRLFMKGKFDSAQHWLDKGIVFAQKSGDHQLLAKYYMEMGSIFSYRADYAKALTLTKKASPHLDRIESYDLKNKYLLLVGKHFGGLMMNDSALYYFQKCEQLNNKVNPYRNWLVYTEMALLFQYSDAYAKAEEYFQKAYALTKARGIRMDHGVVLNHFAVMYYEWAKPEKFALILKEHDDLVRTSKKDLSKDPVHSMLFIDWKNKSLDEKVHFMTNVKNELLKDGYTQNGALANTYIAGFYEQNNQPEEALKYVMENQKLSELEKDFINLYINTKAAYRLSKKAGRHDEANAFADKLFVLKDSMIRMQHREMVFDMETKYQTQKKEQEIILLNSKAELDEKEIALLNAQNKFSASELLRTLEQRKALQRENILMDSVVRQQQLNNELLERENDLKNLQLEKELALKVAAGRVSELQTNELVKEKRIRLYLILGSLLFLVSAAVILYQYQRQRLKNLLIQKQADEMQVLLREIHHRVKNNLQVISSLLDLQSMTISDNQAFEAVKEGKNRVQSMALIHQNLYSEGNIKGIRMNDYIQSLARNLFDSYNIRNEDVKLRMNIENLNLDVDTVIPIGLIMNELISNSLKYAFKDRGNGVLSVELKEANNKLLLRVHDNGNGFPAGWNSISKQSFGFKLINAFAQKLKGKLDIYNDNGACVSMQISRYKMAESLN